MKYSLRQLEVFLATAEHESISRAADSLAMSQSAASESLKNLEAQFDIQLFDRIGKRLQLNSLGQSLRPQAEALLERALNFEAALSQHANIGRLKIGATLSIGNYLAVGIVAKFKQRFPEANISLTVANTTEIARRITNYQLDVGLIEGEIVQGDLNIEPWRGDELAVFCSPEHPYARKNSLNDADLLAAQWILREQGSGTRQAFDYAMHGILSKLHIMLELQHTEAIKRAVEAGMGLGCLSQVTLADAFKRGSLVKLKVPNRDFKRQFYFVLHQDKYRSEAIERWLELCRESHS